MKTTKYFFLLLAAMLVGLTSCEKDEDKIYLSSIEAGDLVAIAPENGIILSAENNTDIVLSLAWTCDKLLVSDPSVTTPQQVVMTLQASLSEDFSTAVVESKETATSKAYTGSALNTLANNLFATAATANTIYFRVVYKSGTNMYPVYSRTVSTAVTPYEVDMSVGTIIDSKQVATGSTLYSANKDGRYIGFMGATSFQNFYLKESNETVWGNDGVDGSPFLLSSSNKPDERWNCWFPEPSGCYYVDFNTPGKVWSALHIPALTVSGDIQGEMTFDRPNLKWTLVFDAAQAGDITIQVAGTGQQYDYSTGDAASNSRPVAFGQEGETLTFGEQAGNITVNIPEAGESTLTIDLSNPRNWTAKVTSGGAVVEEAYPCIYLLGADDGIVSGGWHFNTILNLYDEETWTYNGVSNVNSLWGYQIAVEADNWGDIYTLGEGDANSGTLVAGSGTNLPAPAPGIYFFNISLKGLTYRATQLGSNIYCTGLNNDWDTFVPLAETATQGVYSGTINITTVSEWGFKLSMFDSWREGYEYYGGNEGKLYYNGDGITDDATLGIGTYTMTVDLINQTYTIQ